MTLTPGTRLGPYEIVGSIGAGGMGEVYRARDTRLNRDAAVKVLPEILAADPDRLARFTREAQTLAALNHPNIATIYGVESNAIVMELVDGEDLSALVARGPLTTADALRIAGQIIAALEAAHELGIVHRDLKPANIKIREDGTVKVLDFGLAKAAESTSPAGGTENSPTLTARATAMGVVLGTAAYMSPEQARGRAVDKRTDVWAFGCVLYELLSGRKAFDGEDATEIISSVVKTEPDWTALPATVPANVRTVIVRCLIKDRKTRLPDLSVVRFLLDEAAPTSGPSVQPIAAATPSRSRMWQVATAAFLLTTVVAGVAWYRNLADNTPARTTRFTIQPPQDQIFTAGGRPGPVVPTISPDGHLIAFTAQDSAGKRLLWIREIDSLIAHPLAGTDGAAYPFWSPDSRFIAYAITGKLMRVPVAGGPPLMVCALNAGITSRGGSWSKSDVLVFNNGPAVLSRVSASGGNATPIGTLKSGESGRQFPFFLPDGRHFLYFATGASEQVAGLYAGSLDDETTTRIMSTTTGAIFDEKTGRLLFTRQGTLLAQPFDAATFKVSGEPTPVGERVESVVVPGVVAFSVSTTGMLVYGTGESSVTDFQLTWVDRHGRVLGTLGTPAPFRGIALSPNGLQLATHRHEADGGDIWVTDIERNATTRLTFDAQQENSSPVWSPTGSQIAFSSLRNGAFGIYVKSVNGTGAETKLFESPGIGSLVPFSWAPDNSSLVFMMPGAKTSTDLWRVSLSADHKVTPVLQSPASENHGQFSPDGRWLAYTSTETGKPEVYVKPAFADTGKWNVSGGSGNAPRWRGDSREIFYISASGKMMAVAISVKGDALVPGTPAPLFDYVGIANIGHPSLYSWAVTADGQRFLLSNLAAGASAIVQEPIVVVLNWRSAIAK